MARNAHHATGIEPFELCNCADLGDTPVNPVDIEDTLERVENFYREVHEQNILPLTAGGDHLISLPLRGKVESLNVSVAAGICLYEIQRARGACGGS